MSNGYSFGFDIVDITGMPGGTVYPALRRLEDAGYLTSKWEKERVAHADAPAAAQVLTNRREPAARRWPRP